MLNIGTGEFVLIILVLLLVFGPDKLPGMLRSAGKVWRTFQQESQKATETLRAGFDPALQELKGPGVIDTPDAAPPRPAVAPAAAAIPIVPVDGPMPAPTPPAPEIEEADEPDPEPSVPPAMRRYEDT